MKPPSHVQNRIAAVGVLSNAAVHRYFAGLPVRPLTLARIERALSILRLPDRNGVIPSDDRSNEELFSGTGSSR